MLKVGLTGGIACGKSVVGKMFAARGVQVVQADRIAHDLMRPGQAVYEAVVERFGLDILDGDGTINRQKLSAVVFAPDQITVPAGQRRIDQLNAIVHPAVVAQQDRWTQDIRVREPHGIAMVEAALILEAGVRDHFDKLVVVVCAGSQKIERLARRLRIDFETARREVERRSAAQLPDTEKAAAADYVIYNTGSLAETEQQVESIYKELRREAEQI